MNFQYLHFGGLEGGFHCRELLEDFDAVADGIAKISRNPTGHRHGRLDDGLFEDHHQGKPGCKNFRNLRYNCSI